MVAIVERLQHKRVTKNSKKIIKDVVRESDTFVSLSF